MWVRFKTTIRSGARIETVVDGLVIAGRSLARGAASRTFELIVETSSIEHSVSIAWLSLTFNKNINRI